METFSVQISGRTKSQRSLSQEICLHFTKLSTDFFCPKVPILTTTNVSHFCQEKRHLRINFISGQN